MMVNVEKPSRAAETRRTKRKADDTDKKSPRSSKKRQTGNKAGRNKLNKSPRTNGASSVPRKQSRAAATRGGVRSPHADPPGSKEKLKRTRPARPFRLNGYVRKSGMSSNLTRAVPLKGRINPSAIDSRRSS